MNDIINMNKNGNLKASYKQFEILLKISLIIGIIIVSGFIIYYLLTPEPGYVTSGILNQDKKAENYPTKAKVNESIPFYITVGNYMNRDFLFQLKIKKGNNNTLIGQNIPSNGTLDFIIGNFSLIHKENWISERIDVSFSEPGENQRLIVEVWQIKNKDVEFNSNLWMWLNITI